VYSVEVFQTFANNPHSEQMNLLLHEAIKRQVTALGNMSIHQ
jgi:hypothetical protein